jgi:hypothetical protein
MADPYKDLPPDVAAVMRRMDKSKTLEKAKAALSKGTVRGGNVQSGGLLAQEAANAESVRQARAAKDNARLRQAVKSGMRGRKGMGL